MNLRQKIYNLFITKDTLLQEDLEVIDKRIESANNLKELFVLLKFIKLTNLNFKNEKSVKSYTYVFLFIIVFLFLIGFIFLFQGVWPLNAFMLYFFCVFTIGIFGTIYSWSVAKQFLSGKQISDLISLKKVALDNNLEFDKSDKKELIQLLESQFFIFQQGNFSREIKRYIKGEQANKFIYHYFNLHYVNAHTSTSTDANGNKTSSTIYSDHDLYGIIIPFNIKHFIKVSNYEIPLKFKKFIKWKTSSLSFNKKFVVYAKNEQAAALFLQPKIIEQIEELYKIFTELDIEISPQGLLTLSTPVIV